MGLLTSDIKVDQMRTAFMLEGAIDAARLDRELADMEATLRAMLEVDGVPPGDISVASALDARYVGQGYELRIPLPERCFTEATLEEFHRLHEQEYGHAFRDPIEIVNLRVTVVGKRKKLDSLPIASGTLAEARIGDGEGIFRVDGELTTLATPYYDRSRLPIDEPFVGPAVLFQRDTTVLVPPGWNARADAAGNLLLTR